MKVWWWGLMAVLSVGCTSSVQVVESIPTPPIAIDTTQPASVWTFRGDSAAVVASILEAYCKGQTSGTTDGTDWTATLYTPVERDTVYLAKPTIRIVVKRDTVRVPVPVELVKELNRLRAHQETHRWWELVGGAIACVLGGMVAGFALGKIV